MILRTYNEFGHFWAMIFLDSNIQILLWILLIMWIITSIVIMVVWAWSRNLYSEWKNKIQIVLGGTILILSGVSIKLISDVIGGDTGLIISLGSYICLIVAASIIWLYQRRKLKSV